MKGGLEHILVKETHDRLAAPKGRDMTSLMRILSLLADGMLKHLQSMDENEDEDEDEDEDEGEGEDEHEHEAVEGARARLKLCPFIDSYNSYIELSRIEAPTGNTWL